MLNSPDEATLDTAGLGAAADDEAADKLEEDCVLVDKPKAEAWKHLHSHPLAAQWRRELNQVFRWLRCPPCPQEGQATETPLTPHRQSSQTRVSLLSLKRFLLRKETMLFGEW